MKDSGHTSRALVLSQMSPVVADEVSAGRGRRDLEISADLSGEPEVDLAMTRHRSRSFAVEAPETVVAAFPQQSRAVMS